MLAPSLSSCVFSTCDLNLQGLRHTLLGDRWTGEAVRAQALRVYDVLARLDRHVLADLGGVTGGQLQRRQGWGAHRQAEVVHHHLADVALLLELVVSVQVVVAVRADTVDVVPGGRSAGASPCLTSIGSSSCP